MATVQTLIAKQIARSSKFSAPGFEVIGPPGIRGGSGFLDLCRFLDEGPIKAACEAAGGLFGNGTGSAPNGGFTNQPVCIWPARIDPISGECKLFLGEQEGADPGRPVVGGFGLPAMVPQVVGSITKRDGTTGPILRCMRGMVLGIDSLCYPKAVMPRRSKFRKWRGAARPAVSAGDVKAIRRAAAAKERVLNLAKDVGLFASKTKPAPRPKAHQHLIAPPVQELRVISEHTN